MAVRASVIFRDLELRTVLARRLFPLWVQRMADRLDTPPDRPFANWLQYVGIACTGPPSAYRPGHQARVAHRHPGEWCCFDADGNLRDRDQVLIPCRARRQCTFAVCDLADFCAFWHGPRGRERGYDHAEQAIGALRAMLGDAADRLHDIAGWDASGQQGWERIVPLE
jgi:hypothetical protein